MARARCWRICHCGYQKLSKNVELSKDQAIKTMVCTDGVFGNLVDGANVYQGIFIQCV